MNKLETNRLEGLGEERGPLAANQLWKLRLYIAGQTRKSLTALCNLKRICDRHVPGRYQIEVIDLWENPGCGRGDHIIAIPTLIRLEPRPMRRAIGDLSDEERVMAVLDLPDIASL